MNRLKITLLLSYICIASASAAMITPALPAIEHTFHLNHGALEWVISLFLLGYVIGQLPYGPLANRFGRIFALRIGLTLNCIGIIICIIAAGVLNYPFLLIGRMLTALGAASGLSCTFMLINESLLPDQAKQTMSYAIVAFTLGIGLSVLIGGVVTHYLSWEYCFWVLLLHGVMMLYLTKYFKETLKAPTRLTIAKTLCDIASSFKNKQLVIFSLVVGFVSAFAYCYSVAAPMFASQVLNLSADQYGYWNLINMVGMLGSGSLGAFLMKRYGPRHVLIIGFTCLVPVFALFLLIAFWKLNSIWLFFISTALFYLLSGIIFRAGSFFASNAIHNKANAASSMSFINMGSAMLSVIILGYLPFSTMISFICVLLAFFILAILLASPYLLAKDIAVY